MSREKCTVPLINYQLTFTVDGTTFDHLRGTPVHADIDLLREALGNVLDNAVKHSYQGGKIVISADVTDAPEGFEIVVQNTGLPIKQDEIAMVAERGWQGSSSVRVTGEGSGVGLWIVEGIMRAHG